MKLTIRSGLAVQFGNPTIFVGLVEWADRIIAE